MNKFQLGVAALAAAGTLSLTTMAPASADSAASTRNIILGAAAIAGLAIESNVAHKNAQANAVSGYLPDGSRVYGDGHVVGRNGSSYYPGNNGQSVSCNNGSCYVAAADGYTNATSYNDPHRNVNGNPNWNQNHNQNWNQNQNPNRNNNHNGYPNTNGNGNENWADHGDRDNR